MVAVEILVAFSLFFGSWGNLVVGSDHESWRWTWTCDAAKGRCSRSALPVEDDVRSLVSQYSSLEVCRLTCGRYGGLWPKPTGTCTLSRQIVEVDPNSFHFNVANSVPEHVDFFRKNLEYFRSRLFEYCGEDRPVQAPTSVEVTLAVNKKSMALDWATNESYALEISTTGNEVTVEIASDTVYGARHALETLLQLVAPYRSSAPDRSTGLVMVASARIRDKPSYSHRGLLLDTARNFLPVESIRRQLDGMASTKMNVFHWHATDTQSFPLESKTVPELSRYGAYSPEQVYSASDIKEIVDYARLRGIRTILEIDAPSHSGNGWQFGPDLGLGNLAVCVNRQPWRQFCIQPPCGQLNPFNPNTYGVLGCLYGDLLDLLPAGEAFHMGGDEVFLPCWNSTPEIVEEMRKSGRGTGVEDYMDLWGEFQEKALRAFDGKVGDERTPVVLWSSQLTEPGTIQKYLSPERYIIQTWTKDSTDLPDQLLRLGYRLIVSIKNAWYLDHGFWGNTQYYTWRTAYKATLPEGAGVLGGEACMWGEYVDGGALDYKVWPRTAAVAERLWSNPTRDTASAEPRFNTHRERLIARGLRPDAVSPKWCQQNEGECY